MAINSNSNGFDSLDEFLDEAIELEESKVKNSEVKNSEETKGEIVEVTEESSNLPIGVEQLNQLCNDFEKQYKEHKSKLKNKSDSIVKDFEKMMGKHLKIIDSIQNMIIDEKAYNHLLLASYTKLIETSSRTAESIFSAMDKKKTILEEDMFEDESGAIPDSGNKTINNYGNIYCNSSSFLDDTIEGKDDLEQIKRESEEINKKEEKKNKRRKK